VRRLALPDSPDKYEVKLPSDFKVPDGVDFKFNDADPNLALARQVMHDIDAGKVSGQEAFSKLLGLYAGAQVADQARITAARTAEVSKLGANGTARVTAVTTFFKSFLGEAEGSQLASRMFTASDIAIAEKLIQKVSSQGGAPFRANGREPPQAPGRVSDEQFAKMSARERLDYARGFDQTQFNGAQR
jgi:hypothetical protein